MRIYTKDTDGRYEPKAFEIAMEHREHLRWLESDGREGERMDLQNCNMGDYPFRGLDLRKADLRDSVWYGDLSGADLSGADLRHANLEYTDLTDANLEGALIYGAHLKEGQLDKTLGEPVGRPILAPSKEQVAEFLAPVRKSLAREAEDAKARAAERNAALDEPSPVSHGHRL